MQVRDQLIQETEGLSEPILVEVLDFVQGLKGRSLQTIQESIDRQALMERVEYLETVLGIQKGLASFDGLRPTAGHRGEGIPADEALASLRQKFNIPSRESIAIDCGEAIEVSNFIRC